MTLSIARQLAYRGQMRVILSRTTRLSEDEMAAIVEAIPSEPVVVVTATDSFGVRMDLGMCPSEEFEVAIESESLPIPEDSDPYRAFTDFISGGDSELEVTVYIRDGMHVPGRLVPVPVPSPAPGYRGYRPTRDLPPL